MGEDLLGEHLVRKSLVALEGDFSDGGLLAFVDREGDLCFRFRLRPFEGHTRVWKTLLLVQFPDGLDTVFCIEEPVAPVAGERGCLENAAGGQRHVSSCVRNELLALIDSDTQQAPVWVSLADLEGLDPNSCGRKPKPAVVGPYLVQSPVQALPRHPGPDPENLPDLARITVLHAFQLDRVEPDVVAPFDPVIDSDGAVFGILLEAGGHLGVIPALPLVQGFDQFDLSGQGVLSKGIALLHGEDPIDGGGKDQPVPLDPDPTDPFDLPEVEQDRDPLGGLFYLDRHRSEEPARLEGLLDGPDLVDGCPAAFPQWNQGQECLGRRGVVLGA